MASLQDSGVRACSFDNIAHLLVNASGITIRLEWQVFIDHQSKLWGQIEEREVGGW
jgi:hypothetical protein